jgi:hypothetical protein
MAYLIRTIEKHQKKIGWQRHTHSNPIEDSIIEKQRIQKNSGMSGC